MEAACQVITPLLRTTVKEQRTPYNKLVVQILDLLQTEGYIRGFRVEEGKIRILLKYYQGAPVIRNIRTISRPMRDIFVTPSELKVRTRYNTGLWVISTPYGIVSHRRCIEMGLGGKVMMAVNNGHQHWC